MPERPQCVRCGKDAIGVQSFGCRTVFVCEDHAHSILRALAPGRKYSNGDCLFGRFGASGSCPRMRAVCRRTAGKRKYAWQSGLDSREVI